MNVCPGEGVAYDSYYNETDRVITHRGADSNQEVDGSLIRLLAEILDRIPLFPKGEGTTIVLPQHLKEGRQILGFTMVRAKDPIKYTGGISSQR